MINMILETFTRDPKTGEAVITGYIVYYTNGHCRFFASSETLPKHIRQWIADHTDFIIHGFAAKIYMHSKAEGGDCHAVRAARNRYKAKIRYRKLKRHSLKKG